MDNETGRKKSRNCDRKRNYGKWNIQGTIKKYPEKKTTAHKSDNKIGRNKSKYLGKRKETQKIPGKGQRI